MQRTLALETSNRVGKKVKLKGWVNTVRAHGKIIFIDLRDRSGLMQLVFEPQHQEAYQLAQKLKSEWVIEAIGKIRNRPKEMVNPDLETGEIELEVGQLEVISEAETLPFDCQGSGYQISEGKRLKYRYLDLRRKRLKENLKQRQQAIQFIRKFLQKRKFWEIETPILTKSTPEGARDFVVPSRLQPGKFYALPQSPQQYKQLLMVAGFERYFQIPHVFRDEDLRADRLFEHTQIDIEMSFVNKEQIRNLVEQIVIGVTEKVLGKEIQEKPFPVLTYNQAMEDYNRDDPDLRENQTAAYCWVVDFPMFEQKEDGSIGAVHHPFTAVKEKDIKKLRKLNKAKEKKLIKEIYAQQYDLVLNGHEIFGGSIREHRPKVLQEVFEVLGHTKQETQEKFGHLLEAFKYGVPPHGGIAAGFDRWLQVLLGEESIKEVVAFPTTGSGKTAVMDAPSELDPEQLQELYLKIIKDED